MSRCVVAAFRDEVDARGCVEGLREVAPRSQAVAVAKENFVTLEDYDSRYAWLVTVENQRSAIVLAYVRGYTDACAEGVVVPP